MQLNENDIRCDVCALRIKTENGEKVVQRGSKHFHSGRTIKPLNVLDGVECDQYGQKQGS